MVVQYAQLLPCQQELTVHRCQEGWGYARLGLQQSKGLLSFKCQLLLPCWGVGAWEFSEAVWLAVTACRLARLACHGCQHDALRMTLLTSDAGPLHVMHGHKYMRTSKRNGMHPVSVGASG